MHVAKLRKYICVNHWHCDKSKSSADVCGVPPDARGGPCHKSPNRSLWGNLAWTSSDAALVARNLQNRVLSSTEIADVSIRYLKLRTKNSFKLLSIFIACIAARLGQDATSVRER